MTEVLMYNIAGDKAIKIKLLCRKLNISAREVQKEDYGKKLGALLSESSDEGVAVAEDFDDEMYLASALYTLGRQYGLGSIVPSVAFNAYGTVTVKSLAKYLDNLA